MEKNYFGFSAVQVTRSLFIAFCGRFLILLLGHVGFMCLYAVKQVSAQQAEPAATAVTDIKPLQIGDTIPEYLWNLPLQMVNHPPAGGKDTITLNDFRDRKLIILDFWATYCKPCVEALDRLDNIHQELGSSLAIIPIHLYDYNRKAEPFAKKRNWGFPIAVGNTADTVLNRTFFNQKSFGQVWIKDGKLFAIPELETVQPALIEAVIAGRNVSIIMNDRTTYSNNH